FRKLSNDVARIFLRSKQPTAKRTEFQLTDLKKFVTYERASIRFCRKMATTTEPSTTDVNKRKQLSSSPAKQVFMLHSVVGEDVSDSEDEDDEVFIDAKFGDVKVPLLWDPGARKTLLPASLFEHNDLKKRFRSASGHPIRSSGPKRFDMQVNGH